MNVHHIEPEADGGPNTIENAICLCLRCHAEAGHVNPRHPLETKYSPNELLRHRDEWWAHCAANPGEPLGLFLNIGFRNLLITPELHRYRLAATYRNTLTAVHEGWRAEFFFPNEVPVEAANVDAIGEKRIGSLWYSQFVCESRDRVFPGQELVILPTEDRFTVYDVDNRVFARQKADWCLRWRFFAANAPVIDGEKPFSELHQF